MKWMTAMLSLALTMAASMSEARIEHYVIDYNGQEFNGNSTLFLKRALNRIYPGLDLRDADLVAVRLVAKSRHGRGAAYLLVGNDQTRTFRIDGNPMKWMIDHPSTFEKIDFQAPIGRSRAGDAWQIQMTGNIKVDRVVVALDDWGRGRGPIDRDPRDPRNPRRPR